jgi:hypothetical protein
VICGALAPQIIVGAATNLSAASINMHAVQSVRRSITGRLDLKQKARPETLRVSAGYAHLFKHM